MDYVYDLISGNVHRVDFQTGQIDQWHHTYHYDADNRITDVYTTTATPLSDAAYGTTDIENEQSYNPLWVKNLLTIHWMRKERKANSFEDDQQQALARKLRGTMSVYEYAVDNVNSTVTYTQEEKYMYGSSRLGVWKESVYLFGSVTLNKDMSQQAYIIGQRTSELTNHLGNVLSTINDKPLPAYSTSPMYDNDFSSSYSPVLFNDTITKYP